MASRTELYRKILAEYDQRRMAAEKDRALRQALVFSKIPRLEEIHAELVDSGLKAARLVLSDPALAQEKGEELAAEARHLAAEKAALLTEAGFSADFLEPRYQCAACKDTGYVAERPCTCFKQRLMELSYGQSNLAKTLQTENFDYFDFRLYSPDTDPGHGVSPREHMQQIFDRSLDFVEKFPQEFANLLLYGDTGLGKTFLCNCIAKEILDKGYTVLYLTAGQLFKLAEAAQFRKWDEEEEAADALEDVLKVDLLIIDDLGTEFATILTASALFHILNSRLLSQKHTVVSTNLSLRDLRDQYSERVLSRMMGDYEFLEFFGEDIRYKK